MDYAYHFVSATVAVDRGNPGKPFVYLKLDDHPLLTKKHLFRLALQHYGPKAADPKKLIRPTSWRGNIGLHVTLAENLITYEGRTVEVLFFEPSPDTGSIYSILPNEETSKTIVIALKVIIRNPDFECKPKGSCHITMAQELRPIEWVENRAKILQNPTYREGLEFYDYIIGQNVPFFRFGPKFGTFKEHIDTPYIAFQVSYKDVEKYLQLEKGAKLFIDDKFTNLYQEKFYHFAQCKCYFFSMAITGVISKSAGFTPWHLGNLILSTFHIHNENKPKSCPIAKFTEPTKIDIIETIGLECVKIIETLKENFSTGAKKEFKIVDQKTATAIKSYNEIIPKIDWKKNKIWTGPALEADALKQVVVMVSSCILLMKNGDFRIHEIRAHFPEIGIFLKGKRLENDYTVEIDPKTGTKFSNEAYDELKKLLNDTFQNTYKKWNKDVMDYNSGDTLPVQDPNYYEMEKLLNASR